MIQQATVKLLKSMLREEGVMQYFFPEFFFKHKIIGDYCQSMKDCNVSGCF